MKLVNYQLQTQIELLSENKSQQFFKDYLTSILEDQLKPYYSKADYIGLSLNELKNKIDDISSSIKELQSYKKKLSGALDIAKTITAEVFASNGVDRIDGNILSSITLSKPSSKTKTDISILDEQEVMKLGYVKFSPDIEAIEKALQTDMGKKELENLVSVINITTTTPAKVKINTKRSSATNNVVDEIITIESITEQKQAA